VSVTDDGSDELVLERAPRGFLPRQTLARHATIAGGGAVVLAGITMMLAPFPNYKVAAIAYTVIAVAGLNVLTGLNGQLSLGHGGLMAIGAYTTALLMRHQGFHVWIAVITAVVVTAGAGAIVGIAAARLRGPYLAGATLALAVALPTIATHYAGFLGGEQGIPVPSLASPTALGDSFPPERWLAWVSLIAALITLMLLANLARGRIGRTFRAVRDDEIAAQLAGIHVARTQVLAFIVSAACAGLAGSFLAFWVSLTAPSGFSVVLSLQLLTAIVIGGLGTLTGSVLGATLIVLVSGWASSLGDRLHLSSAIKDNMPLALYGAVLVIAMLAFPAGIDGGVRRIRAIARTRRDNVDEPRGP
jgi:branched-chain amino acid transport system permease protein